MAWMKARWTSTWMTTTSLPTKACSRHCKQAFVLSHARTHLLRRSYTQPLHTHTLVLQTDMQARTPLMAFAPRPESEDTIDVNPRDERVRRRAEYRPLHLAVGRAVYLAGAERAASAATVATATAAPVPPAAHSAAVNSLAVPKQRTCRKCAAPMKRHDHLACKRVETAALAAAKAALVPEAATLPAHALAPAVAAAASALLAASVPTASRAAAPSALAQTPVLDALGASPAHRDVNDAIRSARATDMRQGDQQQTADGMCSAPADVPQPHTPPAVSFMRASTSVAPMVGTVKCASHCSFRRLMVFLSFFSSSRLQRGFARYSSLYTCVGVIS